MWHSRPPPFMANAILNFHFDYWHTSLTQNTMIFQTQIRKTQDKSNVGTQIKCLLGTGYILILFEWNFISKVSFRLRFLNYMV